MVMLIASMAIPVQRADATGLVPWPVDSIIEVESAPHSISLKWGLTGDLEGITDYEITINDMPVTVTGEVYGNDQYRVTIPDLAPAQSYSIGISSEVTLDIFVPVETALFFPDPALKLKVQEQLGLLPTDEIMPEDVIGLTYLYAESAGITSLEGIQDLTELTELYLADNELTNEDLSPLSQLQLLKWLDLSANQLTDFSNLANLPTLTELNVPYNEITRIDGVSQLANLLVLDISDNQVGDEDLVELSSLEFLDELYARANQISSLDFLGTMVNLGVVDLSMNKVDDLSPLLTLATARDGEDHSISLDLTYNQLDFNYSSPDLPLVGQLGESQIYVNTGYLYVDTSRGTTATVHWTPPFFEDLEVDGYYIWVDEVKHSLPGELWIENEYFGDLFYELEGLTPGESYDILVQAEIAGRGTYDIGLPYVAEIMPVHSIDIPDGNLRDAIYEALPDLASPDPITNYDLLDLTSLSAPEAGIVSLEGLQLARNLETLSLPNNLIYDITPLYHLELQSLNLNDNRISMFLDSDDMHLIDYEVVEGYFAMAGNYLSPDEVSEIEGKINGGWGKNFLDQKSSVPWSDGHEISQTELTATSVNLAWPTVAGATSYVIHHNQNPEPIAVAGTTLELSGLQPHSKHTFKVEAIVDGVETFTGPYIHVYTSVEGIQYTAQIELVWDEAAWSSGSLDGIPVVAMKGTERYTAFTDESGVATFGDLDAGSYEIVLGDAASYEVGGPSVIQTQLYGFELTEESPHRSGVVYVLPLKPAGSNTSEPFNIIDVLWYSEHWDTYGRDFNLDDVMDPLADRQELLKHLPALVTP